MTTELERTAEVDGEAPQSDRPRAPRWAGPAAGFAAGAAAVCIGMLVAALFDVVSPIDAVGNEFIERVPAWLKDLAIDWFGTNDKKALRAGIWITLALASLAVGALARRRPLVGYAGIALFGIVGAAACASRPDAGSGAIVPPLLGAAIGCVLLGLLVAMIRAGDGPTEFPGAPAWRRDFDRRRFLATSGGATATAVVAFAAAERLEQRRLDRLRASAPDTLPTVAPAPTVPPDAPDATDTVPGSTTPAIVEVPEGAQVSPATPFVTPNDDFYLIDTALSIPRIDRAGWELEVTGMVSTPLRLTYDDLLARPQVERMITIACVSNEVGGGLIGNAVWQGVFLADVLAEAGVDPEAEQVFSTSVDGWTCGFPVSAALDGRDCLIAIGMNGEALPLEHGYPARLIVPGLYGYVSATKWLKTIELNRWDDATGYWVPRGWAREAPIKTQSRIDVPKRNDDLVAGPIVIAGVAWAQRCGIDRVEVSVDRGEWVEATLGTEATDDTWRQWTYVWDATPGEHVIQCRATDGTGETQTMTISRPDPDGATGWHTRTVRVSA